MEVGVSDQTCLYHATFIPSYRGAARLGQELFCTRLVWPRRSRDGLGLPGLIVSSWEQTFGATGGPRGSLGPPGLLVSHMPRWGTMVGLGMPGQNGLPLLWQDYSGV